MSEHLEAAAAAIGAPAELVERSAAARAQASGASVDDILAAWAGGGSAPTSAAPPQRLQPKQHQPRQRQQRQRQPKTRRLIWPIPRQRLPPFPSRSP